MFKRILILIFISVLILAFGVQKNETLEPLFKIAGAKENTFFGKSIGFYSDIDHDGVSELVVGSDRGGKEDRGKVQIFLSSMMKKQMLNTEAAFTMEGPYPGNKLGWDIASENDINGDGIPDLIISGIGSKIVPGNIIIFYGKKDEEFSPNLSPEVVISSKSKNELFGWSICSNGDFNGDGINDIAVGATDTEVDSVTECGKVYIFFGKEFENNLTTENADFVIMGHNKEKLGNSVSFVKDTDGDGKDELLAGAFTHFTEKGFVGRSYIIKGTETKGTFKTENSEYIIEGEEDFDFFGKQVIGINDIDNDGKGDFIISSNSNGEAGLYAGKVYIFSGKHVTSKISIENADLIYEGDYGFCSLGSSMDAVGNSIIISGQGSVQKKSVPGSVYKLVLNSLTDDKKNKFNLLIKNENLGSAFGNEVKFFDIDNDGKSEVFVAAYFDNINGEKSGSVYAYKIK